MKIGKWYIFYVLLCIALVSNVSAKESSIAEGIYILESAKNPKKVLDIESGSCSNSAPLQIYEKNFSEAQKFYIYKSKDGYFRIRAVCSGKLLTGGSYFNDSKNFSKTGIFQKKFVDSDYQKWKLEESERGGFYLICKANDLIAGFDERGGSKIKLWKQNINKGQRFKLKPIKIFNSDGYTISTDKNDMCIDKMQILFKSLGKDWSLRKLKRIIENSSMCFGVFDKKGNQVGFARVITDYETTCFVMNVVIDKRYRGLGIGTKLMRYIIEHDKLRSCQFSLTPSSSKVAHTYGLVGFKKAHCTYMRTN